MEEFARIQRLPPYVFAVVVGLKSKLRHAGEDIIDLGMGNPDSQPEAHRRQAGRGGPQSAEPSLLPVPPGSRSCGWPSATGTSGNTTWSSTRKRRRSPRSERRKGLSHLVLATMGPGDIALVPSPTYRSTLFGDHRRGGRPVDLSHERGGGLHRSRRAAIKTMWPRPKMMILSFPHNPTTQVVDLDFFKRVVAFAKEHNLLVIHDLAYADLVFDGYKAPSILQVPGQDVAVESYSMSKGYSMPGWRVGFVVGNKRMVGALTRMKSYLDYGCSRRSRSPPRWRSTGRTAWWKEAVEIYRKRRDCLVDGFARIGWEFEKPKGTMFVWAPIPEPFREMGSVEFSKLLLTKAKVAVSPGSASGNMGKGSSGSRWWRTNTV